MTKPDIAAPGAESAPPSPTTGSAPVRLSTTIAAIGLVWLAVTLAVGHGSLHGSSGDVALSTAVLSLPALLQAALFAGAATGFAVSLPIARTGLRYLAGVLSGLAVGVIALAVVLWAYAMPTGSSIAMAAAVALAGALGGALGAVRPAPMISSGLLAMIPVLVIGYLVGHFSDELLRLFGDSGSAAGRYSASGYLGFTSALLQGLFAGIVAFVLLRRSGLKFPAYGLAGALPGLVIGVAEVFTRVAAPRLLSLATEVSPWDKIIYGLGNGNRTNQALVVFFVGALTAIIAHGRTLGRSS
jgi:hypothetical protein